METIPRLLALLFMNTLTFDRVFCNNPPFVDFGPPSSNVFFEENTPIGASLFTISAEDSDSDLVTFTFEDTAADDLVELDQVVHDADNWHVDVLLKAPLDRDRSPNIRSLWFKVSDGQSEIRGQVKLIIRDVNDNPPSFVGLPYRIELEEGTDLLGQTVLVASARDPDDGPGGSVVYSMAGADETYSQTFVIPNENMGDIVLGRELDYETRNYYQYQIFAKDRGSPACPGEECQCSNLTENVNCEGDPATFIVIVKDVQDTPPFFERLPYIADVSENASVGTSFYQVLAHDGDRGVPNDVQYSIVDEANVPFTMESSTGILRVGVDGLDSDNPEGRNYVLTIMASEKLEAGQTSGTDNQATTQLSITVDDVNDNGPVWGQGVYHARVLENTPRGVPLTLDTAIEVSDKDQNENSQFKLTVEQGDLPYTAFTTLPGPSVIVHGLTTVMVNVYNASVLDYELTKNITFQLRATETSTTEENTNTTTIIVTIEDMNDNSPVFLPDQTTAVQLTEHAPQDMVLATFSATDADDGHYGTVSYSLEDGLGKFDIGSQSGDLTVISDVDREEPGGSGYSLVVVATDNMAGDEAQRRSRRLNIRVTVQDINDNAPLFQSHAPFVTVQENASPGTVLMTLTATDRDEGVNSDVIYHVISIESPTYTLSEPQNLFDIDRTTGVVSVNASLIGYPGPHTVTVVAFDSPVVAEERKNDTTSVTVHVQDVNINEPVFVVPDQSLVSHEADSLPNVTVDEEMSVGSLILQLNATDGDTGNNGLVYYSLDPDLDRDFVLFDVDAITGQLTNRARLDRETRPMYQITLKAQDQGTPTQLSKSIDFRVILRDVNDHDPRFPAPATLTLSVGEELRNVEVGFVNVAVDDDNEPVYKVICYYIYGGDMVEAFLLTKDTGELRVLTELDRDDTPELHLIIKASADCSWSEDHFTRNNGSLDNAFNASDSSLLQVVVGVIDINDNPPVFDKAALTVGLLYDVPIGFEVINLVTFTLDEDTPINSRNYYELEDIRLSPGMPGESSPSFTLTRNGSLLTNRLFRADEDGFFVLGVKAFDSVGQTDEAEVTIYLVTDVQRVRLVFNRRPNDVERIKGTLVRQLGEALGLTIIADKIATHITTSGTPEANRTDMYIHARRPSGEIVPASELWNAFDYNLKVREIFQDYGVVETIPVLVEQLEDEDRDLEIAFIVVIIVLAIVCLVLLVVLINTIRRYRRRLRAATTCAFVSRPDESDSNVPPGTNKYYAAENPLYGKEMKPAFIERLDSDSLDDNAVGNATTTTPGSSTNDLDHTDHPDHQPKDKEEEQEMYLELYDDDNPGKHINHLSMVLNQYEQGGGGEGSTLPPPYPSSSSSSKGLTNGHVKSDSGFNDHDGDEEEEEEAYRQVPPTNLDKLQYTDI